MILFLQRQEMKSDSAMQELLAELNKDLAWECAAVIQYAQRAAAINDAKYQGVSMSIPNVLYDNLLEGQRRK